jgi:hypothetical protein
MTQILTPHTVCLVRLLTYQEESGVLMSLRFKKALVEEVVSFVITEMQVSRNHSDELLFLRRNGLREALFLASPLQSSPLQQGQVV